MTLKRGDFIRECEVQMTFSVEERIGIVAEPKGRIKAPMCNNDVPYKE